MCIRDRSYDEGTETVLFAHTRESKMIGLCAIKGQDFKKDTPVNGSFVMKKGDKVLILSLIHILSLRNLSLTKGIRCLSESLNRAFPIVTSKCSAILSPFHSFSSSLALNFIF